MAYMPMSTKYISILLNPPKKFVNKEFVNEVS